MQSITTASIVGVGPRQRRERFRYMKYKFVRIIGGWCDFKVGTGVGSEWFMA